VTGTCAFSSSQPTSDRATRARHAASPTDAFTRDDLAGSLGALGEAQAAAGDIGGARQSLSEQLRMYREMSAADPANAKTRTALSAAAERLQSLGRRP